MSPLIGVLWLAAYLFGAVPYAFIIARIYGVDLYSIGSGNIGATNVSRALGRKWGVTVFVLDFLKGAIPVYFIMPLAKLIDADYQEPFGITDLTRVGAGGLALLGHIYPVYLGFKGGKGVATGSGVALTLMPIPGAAAFVGWIITAAIFRYVSLASIIASVILVTLRLTLTPQPFGPNSWLVSGFCILGTLFVMFKHRSNIQRLLNGTESKIGDRAPQISTTSTSS
jgi:acyl phosphate:glycerol-3-phosphate acyltransferase